MHDFFASIVQSHVAYESMHMLLSPYFIIFISISILFFHKNTFYNLVNMIIVNPTQDNHLPTSWSTLGFATFEVVQMKERVKRLTSMMLVPLSNHRNFQLLAKTSWYFKLNMPTNGNIWRFFLQKNHAMLSWNRSEIAKFKH